MEIKKDTKHQSMETKIIGWAGTILIITAYSMNSLQYMHTDHILYAILNMLGGTLLGYRVFKNKNWSNLFLEIFWVAIAIASIAKIFLS